MDFLDEINSVVDEASTRELSDKPGSSANDDTPILLKKGFYAEKKLNAKTGAVVSKSGKFALPKAPSLTMNVDFRGTTIQGASVYAGTLYSKPKVYNLALFMDWHFTQLNGEIVPLIPNTGSAFKNKQVVPKIKRFEHLFPRVIYNQDKNNPENFTEGTYLTVPTVIIPLLMKIETTVFDGETGKKTKTSEDRVVIFQQNITDRLVQDLTEKGLIPSVDSNGVKLGKKTLLVSATKYLFGDLLEAEVGTAIGVFKTDKLVSANTGESKNPFVVINMPEKVVTNNPELFDLTPVAEITDEDLTLDVETHLLASGYVAKEDKTSPLRLINDALWEEIKLISKVKREQKAKENPVPAPVIPPTPNTIFSHGVAGKPAFRAMSSADMSNITPEVKLPALKSPVATGVTYATDPPQVAPSKPVVIKRTPKVAVSPPVVQEADDELEDLFSGEE